MSDSKTDGGPGVSFEDEGTKGHGLIDGGEHTASPLMAWKHSIDEKSRPLHENCCTDYSKPQPHHGMQPYAPFGALLRETGLAKERD